MSHRIAWLGLFAGPLFALIAYALLPDTYQTLAGETLPFSSPGRATLAMLVWMATWWLTEAVSMSVTALLPLAFFPLLGIATFEQAAQPYANPIIYLYLGGFVLALSMQRWRLDRRVALLTLSRLAMRPIPIVGGFMAITGVISAFVSNTATAAMMLPIALSVVRLMERPASTTNNSADRAGPPAGPFGICLMLGIAYAASIGGVATPVGTPTNLILVSYLSDSMPEALRLQISFAEWIQFGVPLVAIYLPLTWLVLTRVLFRLSNEPLPGGRELLQRELAELGPVARGEWVTLIIFAATAVLWIARPWLVKLSFGLPLSPSGKPAAPLAGLTDAGIVMLAALLLFVIPLDRRQRTFVMDWSTAERIPWGILLLFGGGLSLAEAIDEHGVAAFLGSHAHVLTGWPPVLLIAGIATFVVFFSEVASNTATAATLLPILVAIAPGLGIHPYHLAFPATLAASCAFMLPAGTPPNAMVFAGGYLEVQHMIRAGWWINWLGIILITLVTTCLLPTLLGIPLRYSLAAP